MNENIKGEMSRICGYLNSFFFLHSILVPEVLVLW